MRVDWKCTVCPSAHTKCSSGISGCMGAASAAVRSGIFGTVRAVHGGQCCPWLVCVLWMGTFCARGVQAWSSGQVHRVRERRDALRQFRHAGADNILRVRRRRQGWSCRVLRGCECCRRDVRDGEWTCVKRRARHSLPHGTERISRFGERRMRGTLHAVRRWGVSRRLCLQRVDGARCREWTSFCKCGTGHSSRTASATHTRPAASHAPTARIKSSSVTATSSG